MAERDNFLSDRVGQNIALDQTLVLNAEDVDLPVVFRLIFYYVCFSTLIIIRIQSVHAGDMKIASWISNCCFDIQK